jgi:electron transfer flavoprotein alpha subunit
MEIGPALAFRLGMPLFSNCVDLELQGDGDAVVSRSIYGGAWQVKLRVKAPIVASFQKGALSGGSENKRPATLAGFPTSINLNSLKTRVVEIQKPEVGEVDITKAEVIVAAGRGIGQASNLSQIRTLAKALGGVVAGTRPVIDMGWLPAEHLVGLSGKTVAPRVYIACGISGSAQHLAGMSESQVIIAINKDANAPIFSVAHYAVVGDLFTLIPAVVEEVEKRR